MRRVLVAIVALMVLVWLIDPERNRETPVPVTVAAPEPADDNDGATMPERPSAQANEATLETAVPTTPTVTGNATELPPSPRTAPDGEMTELVRKMADRAYTTVGSQFVEYLVSKGLSSSDSERVVADAMPDWVRCQLDATLAQADEQSLSRVAVLAAFDASGRIFAAPAGLDMTAAIIRAQPCRMLVQQQRIGIPDGHFEFRRTDAP